ncbi:MAG: SCP2 sterol-binding domain-containing protein [Candidatus Hodarchaeota archaeon]
MNNLLEELEQVLANATPTEDWNKIVQLEFIDEESLEIKTVILKFENGKRSIVKQKTVNFDIRIHVPLSIWKRLVSGELPIFAAVMANKIDLYGRTEDLLTLAVLLIQGVFRFF